MSNAATGVLGIGSSSSIHSRMPGPEATASSAPLVTASARVDSRLMLKACVGPPITTRSTPARSVDAE